VLAGGEYDDSVGFYVQPTIVETTTPDDKIFKEEIFGPLLTVLVYKDKVGKGHVITTV
jgi:1-pyrroline-5-carboxylate dehydrogenase